MRLRDAIKWPLYLLGALGFGIILGIPQGTASGRLAQVQISTGGFVLPIVKISERDYSASNGTVPKFAQWALGPVCTSFEEHYPPSKINAERQKAFFQRVVAGAVEAGELEPVISGCAMNAIAEANAEEHADPAESASAPPSTILIYAERAGYFGQDVWCFICLTTKDGQHGAVRVIVTSCSPPFGLIHTERIGSY